jgi:hypothetical protein
MKTREWTEDECEQLSKLIDSLGLGEVLHGLANRVIIHHPDFKTGLLIRNQIVKAADLLIKVEESGAPKIVEVRKDRITVKE